MLASLLFASSSVLFAQQRPAITGIAFMRVYVTDPAAAQQFYGTTLGFERHKADGMWIYPVNKLQWLEVIPHAGPEPNHRMAAFGLMTRDAAGLERYLAAHGVKAEQPLHDGEFAVRDPEGNLAVFVQSAVQSTAVHSARGAERPGPIAESRPGSVARMVAKARSSPNATSHRIIHVGFIVRDREKEAAFWQGVLGFRPYWHGGRQPDETDWVSQQAPEGQDWIEFMLRVKEPVDLRQSGTSDHVSLGEESMQDALAMLKKNGCVEVRCSKTQIGHDGKVQLNLFDPDRTRVEFMEFRPTREPCCSAFTAAHPTAEESR